jgi:hypothetical protein
VMTSNTYSDVDPSLGKQIVSGSEYGTEYSNGSNTTFRILDVLEEKRSKIICIEELDRCRITDMNDYESSITNSFNHLY